MRTSDSKTTARRRIARRLRGVVGQFDATALELSARSVAGKRLSRDDRRAVVTCANKAVRQLMRVLSDALPVLDPAERRAVRALREGFGEWAN